MKKLFVIIILLLNILGFIPPGNLVCAFILDYDNEEMNKEVPRVEYTVIMTKPASNSDLKYENDKFKISFYFGVAVMYMNIYNKTDISVKLDYDLMSYVYIDNNSYRVFRSGTDKKDKDKPQSFSIIAPHSNLKTWIRPEYALFPDIYIFPIMGFAGDNLPKDLLLSYKGKSFSIFMPLTIKGALEEYTFTFKIIDVKILE